MIAPHLASQLLIFEIRTFFKVDFERNALEEGSKRDLMRKGLVEIQKSCSHGHSASQILFLLVMCRLRPKALSPAKAQPTHRLFKAQGSGFKI